MAPSAVVVNLPLRLDLAALRPVLAQDATGGAVSIIGWSLVLFAFIVLAFWGVVLLRRWMRADATPVGGSGFGLSELREMHRRGQLTDEEYERAKGKITSAAKAMTSKMPSPAAGRRAPGASVGGPATAARATSDPGIVPPSVSPPEPGAYGQAPSDASPTPPPRPVVRAEPVPPTLDPIPLEGSDDDASPRPSPPPTARPAQQVPFVEGPEEPHGGVFDPIPVEGEDVPPTRTPDWPRPDKSDADATGR